MREQHLDVCLSRLQAFHLKGKSAIPKSQGTKTSGWWNEGFSTVSKKYHWGWLTLLYQLHWVRTRNKNIGKRKHSGQGTWSWSLIVYVCNFRLYKFFNHLYRSRSAFCGWVLSVPRLEKALIAEFGISWSSTIEDAKSTAALTEMLPVPTILVSLLKVLEGWQFSSFGRFLLQCSGLGVYFETKSSVNPESHIIRYQMTCKSK